MKKIRSPGKKFFSCASYVTITQISSLDSGAKMYRMSNDLSSRKYPNIFKTEYKESGKKLYAKDSFNNFLKTLKSDSYYLIVDKAVRLSHGNVYGGHITSFLTDSKADITRDSCVSLRKGEKIPNEILTYTRREIGDNKKRQCRVYHVNFIKSVETELTEYFFVRAIPDATNIGKRFLIEVPVKKLHLSPNEILSRTKYMKEKFSSGYFLLFDGKLNDSKFYKALNCVTGFYSSQFLSGKVINPSPQMSAWSYLKIIFGNKLRGALIDNTGLQHKSVERCEDDELECHTWGEWPPNSTVYKT